MNIQRKLALVTMSSNINVFFVVAEIDLNTGKLISRSYATPSEIYKYLKHGEYYGFQEDGINVIYYSDTLDDIINQVNLLTVLEPGLRANYTQGLLKQLVTNLG